MRVRLRRRRDRRPAAASQVARDHGDVRAASGRALPVELRHERPPCAGSAAPATPGGHRPGDVRRPGGHDRPHASTRPPTAAATDMATIPPWLWPASMTGSSGPMPGQPHRVAAPRRSCRPAARQERAVGRQVHRVVGVEVPVLRAGDLDHPRPRAVGVRRAAARRSTPCGVPGRTVSGVAGRSCAPTLSSTSRDGPRRGQLRRVARADEQRGRPGRRDRARTGGAAAVGHRSQGRDLPPAGGATGRTPPSARIASSARPSAVSAPGSARHGTAARPGPSRARTGSGRREHQRPRRRCRRRRRRASRRDDPVADRAERPPPPAAAPRARPPPRRPPPRSTRCASDSASVYSSITRRSAAAELAAGGRRPATATLRPSAHGRQDPPRLDAGRAQRVARLRRARQGPGRGVEPVRGALEQPAGERQLLQVGDRRPGTADDAVPVAPRSRPRTRRPSRVRRRDRLHASARPPSAPRARTPSRLVEGGCGTGPPPRRPRHRRGAAQRPGRALDVVESAAGPAADRRRDRHGEDATESGDPDASAHRVAVGPVDELVARRLCRRLGARSRELRRRGSSSAARRSPPTSASRAPQVAARRATSPASSSRRRPPAPARPTCTRRDVPQPVHDDADLDAASATTSAPRAPPPTASGAPAAPGA